jgi:hypothetical protein
MQPEEQRTSRIARMLAIALSSAALLPASSVAVAAQQSGAGTRTAAPGRGGFHFSIGLGGASVSATCTGCEVDFFDNRLNGLSGNIQLGGMATSKLAIAAEFSGWLKNDVPVYRRMAALSLVVLGYPSETSGFFVKGGVGGLRAIAENDFVTAQTDAWTAQTGLGYDFRIGGRTMLTAYANYVRTFSGATWLNGVSSPVALLPNAIQFGTAFTIH